MNRTLTNNVYIGLFIEKRIQMLCSDTPCNLNCSNISDNIPQQVSTRRTKIAKAFVDI